MSKGGKQTQTTSQTQNVDPKSQAYVDWLRQTGQGAANAIAGAGPLVAGPNAHMTSAAAWMGGMNPGIAANPALGNAMGIMSNVAGGLMTPIEEQMARFQNPFEQQVVDATRGEFDHMRSQASQAANALAARSGAFGGSRHAVLEAARLGELDRAQASNLAQLRSTGFDKSVQGAFGLRNEAMQALGMIPGAAATEANIGVANQQLGMQHAGQMFNMGEAMRNALTQQFQEPLLRQQAILQMANMGMGPVGMTSSGKQTTQTKTDPFSQILGAAMTFGPMLFGLPPMPGLGGMATPNAPPPNVAPIPAIGFPNIGPVRPIGG